MKTAVQRALERLGYEIHRHPADQRVRVLRSFGIDLVLDVGGGAGQYGRQLRRHGYRGRIVSFEPLLASYQLLTRHAARDSDWVTMRVALGSRAEMRTINVAGNRHSSSILPMLARHREVAPHTAYVSSEPIAVTQLDEVFSSMVGEYTRPFLKIDVQGYEHEVLRGATESLTRMQGLQIELTFVPLYEGGALCDEVLDIVRTAGFSIVQLEPGFLDRHSGQLLQADALFMRDA